LIGVSRIGHSHPAHLQVFILHMTLLMLGISSELLVLRISRSDKLTDMQSCASRSMGLECGFVVQMLPGLANLYLYV
jgi:hypothetical protein